MIPMPQRIPLITPRQSALPPLSDDSNAPADQPHTSAERTHTFKVMIPMPQRITSHASAERTHTFKVMIPMPQRITSPLGRAPSHLQSDDSNAPADHLTYLSEIQMPQRISLTPLSDDSNAPADQTHTSQSALTSLSDDSNAPADQTHTFRVTQRIPLTFLGRAPSYL